MQQRKRYSEEFKREAVGLTRLPGASVSQIARDLGIRANQLHRWRRELEVVGKKAFPGNGVARDQELLALKLELARVKKERDFCAMRRRSSPRNRLEVRGDPTPPRPVPGSAHVPLPEGLAQRLPWLGDALTRRTRAGQREVAREDPRAPCRQRRRDGRPAHARSAGL